MRMMAAGGLLLALWAAPAPASAQSGSVKIHVKYQMFSQRVRPSPGGGTTAVDYTLTLSGKNAISAAGTMSAGGTTRDAAATATLGGTTKILAAGSATSSWRVAGPNRIVGIADYPQSRSTDIITIRGKTCSFTRTDRLKPGFTEYALWSVTLGAVAYYSEVKFLGGTCTISDG